MKSLRLLEVRYIVICTGHRFGWLLQRGHRLQVHVRSDHQMYGF